MVDACAATLATPEETPEPTAVATELSTPPANGRRAAAEERRDPRGAAAAAGGAALSEALP
jgi:hypothetical protein